MNQAKLYIDIFALMVEVIILLGLILGKHDNTRKNRMFLYTTIAFICANVLDWIWIWNSLYGHNFTLARLTLFFAFITSFQGEGFLGVYLICLIGEKKRLPDVYVAAITTYSIIAFVIIIWGSITKGLVYFCRNVAYQGPFYDICLHIAIILGLFEVFIILKNAKHIGLRATLITLSYYILPLITIVIRLRTDEVDMIFAASAISLLVINNLLIVNEKEKALNLKQIAEESEKSKSRFLANMSHEIRTPINAVLGLNEMILRESREPGIISYAHDIKSSGTQLLNLVNDVLDFSKIESGKMELVPIGFETSSLLNDVVNMINIKAEQKGLSFRIEVDPTIPRIIVGDEVRLKQIMTNILSNSVKYTKEGWVRLSLGYEKLDEFSVMLKFTIEDSGVGIADEDMPKLFEAFTRIDEKANINIEGTGLGMAITNHFLGLMNSELHVTSIVGSGSIFSFAIKADVENWEPMGSYQEAFDKLRQKDGIYKARLKAPDARILIVDDMPMNLTVARGLLKHTLVQVDTATSGEEALELMQFNKFDMIFLDHMMPGIDGIETMKRLKAQPENPNINTPVIVLTANAVAGARDEYMEAGFDDYLSKPINPDRIEQALIRYLPKEYVVLIEDSDAYAAIELAEEDFGDNGNNIQEPAEEDKLSRLRRIPNISVDDGIQAASDVDTYLIAMEEFSLTIDEVANRIEKYFNEGDLKNYTIQVHGLKSTARIAGENDLSAMAFELEMAGKNDDAEKIMAGTGPLLERFRGLKQYLEPIFKEETDSDNLPDIDPTEYAEAISMIKTALEDFDFDTVSAVVTQFKDFKLPDELESKKDKIRICLAEVDFDGLSEIFNNL